MTLNSWTNMCLFLLHQPKAFPAILCATLNGHHCHVVYVYVCVYSLLPRLAVDSLRDSNNSSWNARTYSEQTPQEKAWCSAQFHLHWTLRKDNKVATSTILCTGRVQAFKDNTGSNTQGLKRPTVTSSRNRDKNRQKVVSEPSCWTSSAMAEWV